MGSRLFKQLLDLLEEDISGLPFLDILYKMEKLKMIESAKDWIMLRQTRNTVAHEYPFFKEVQIEELNLLPEEVKKLTGIWLSLKEYARNRMIECGYYLHFQQPLVCARGLVVGRLQRQSDNDIV